MTQKTHLARSPVNPSVPFLVALYDRETGLVVGLAAINPSEIKNKEVRAGDFIDCGLPFSVRPLAVNPDRQLKRKRKNANVAAQEDANAVFRRLADLTLRRRNPDGVKTFGRTYEPRSIRMTQITRADGSVDITISAPVAVWMGIADNWSLLFTGAPETTTHM